MAAHGLTALFPRFLATGFASVLIDTGLLVLLRDAFDWPLALATTVAFVTALTVNFGLNMRWVFRAEGYLAYRLFRYGVLVAVNYGLTLIIVLGMSSLGVYYLLSKLVAVGTCVCLNFFAYRKWVFA